MFLNDECINFENVDNVAYDIYSTEFQEMCGIEINENVHNIDSQILDLFDISDSVSDDEKKNLHVLLCKYKHVFAFNDNELGRTVLVEHTIDTGDSLPIHQTPYRIPVSQRGVVEDQVKKLSESGIIRPSSSPYSAPIVLVPKRDGSVRLCIDYRRINAVTKKDVYPLPRIDDMLDALNKSKYFTVLDLCQGYHQVPVRECDKEKTAFSYFGGHWEFNFMPFGLCNSAPTFQRLMDKVLSGLLWNSCLVYIDDVIVFSETLDEYIARLQNVFKRFENLGLKLKAKKCSFANSEVNFLGHTVSAKGISPDVAKVRAISEFPTPTNVSEFRSFIGLVSYYRKFVPDFAKKAAPLHALLKKGVKYLWNPDCVECFETFKKALIQYPILRYLDFELPFVLYTDACDTGLGVVLAQIGPDGERTLAYASRSLKSNERNYAVIEKEALAIYFRNLEIFQTLSVWPKSDCHNRSQSVKMAHEY